MAQQTELVIAPRTVTGKAVKRLRKAGIIPANIFGHDQPSQAIQVEGTAFERLRKAHAATNILLLKMDNAAPQTALIRHIEHDAIRGKVLQADGGAISPFGGAKGFALGLAIELLVAALTETALGERVRGTLDVTDPVTKGDVLIVFDPIAAGAQPFGERLGEYLRELRGSPPAPGAGGVTIPGDRMRAERRRRLTEGIPLPVSLWRELVALREGVVGEASAHA